MSTVLASSPRSGAGEHSGEIVGKNLNRGPEAAASRSSAATAEAFSLREEVAATANDVEITRERCTAPACQLLPRRVASMSQLVDDMGAPVDLKSSPRRVVCLVPSLTEALAETGFLVGATDWCTHPSDLEVTRVRGTKNPDLKAITALAPDLVIANKEENRELDVRRLRERGIPVWVSVTESVPESITAMQRIFLEVLELEEPHWLVQARELWSGEVPEPHITAAIAIWRDPWMVVGRDTFTGDLLARLGVANAYADSPDRYPSTTVEEITARRPGVVLLPDEPYVFTADDGPEAFPTLETVLLSGRLITWYGPALVEAKATLQDLLGRPTIYK